MTAEELLQILDRAAKLKTAPRHCYTAPGRAESVADHSWRIALMAFLLTDEAEFTHVNMNKVIQMCLIHDLGEAFTGDIPTFLKTRADSAKEDDIFNRWVDTFPAHTKERWQALLKEMNTLQTAEAKIYKALDRIEAIISHNESDISTWIPLEYELQLSYGKEQVQFSPYLREFKKVVDEWTREKIEKNKKSG